MLAFVQPTLHGADESYFVLGGSLALAAFVVGCAVYDALVVARMLRMLRMRSMRSMRARAAGACGLAISGAGG